jgi:PGF-CTERM protein
MTATDARCRASAVCLAALACCLAVGLLVPAPVFAGDGTTVFTLDPTELDADPGEEIEIAVVVSAHGDLHGNGIDAAAATLAYDADVFEVTDVEHEAMLEDGDDVEISGSESVDERDGTVTIEQERTPSGDGATGNEPITTVTFAVAEDAEPTTETIELADSSAMLVGDYPQATFERDATVHVDGGDDSGEANADDADTEGVTLADDAEDGTSGTDAGETDDDSEENDAGASDDMDDTETGADDTGDDPNDTDSIPGFTLPATVAGLVLALWLVGRRR